MTREEFNTYVSECGIDLTITMSEDDEIRLESEYYIHGTMYKLGWVYNQGWCYDRDGKENEGRGFCLGGSEEKLWDNLIRGCTYYMYSNYYHIDIEFKKD